MGIICASLILIKPLLQKFFPNMLSSSAPSIRNLHLPTLHFNGAQSSHAWSGTASNTWTCSTFVDSGRRNTVSDSDRRPRVAGINVRVETMQTSESNSRSGSQGSDVGLNLPETEAAWTKAWDEQDSIRQLQGQTSNHSLQCG